MTDLWLIVLAAGSALFVSGLVLWRTLSSRPPQRRRTRERSTPPRPESERTPPKAPPEPDPKPPTLRAVTILFGAESAFLTPAGRAALDQAARRLTDSPGLTVTVEGSADSTGNPTRNLVLARDRAWAARQYLLDRDIAPERIHSVVNPPKAGGTEYERRQLRSVRLTWEAT